MYIEDDVILNESSTKFKKEHLKKFSLKMTKRQLRQRKGLDETFL